MHKKLIILTISLCCCYGLILSKTNRFTFNRLRLLCQNNYDLESENLINSDSTKISPANESGQYFKCINVPATEKMPALSFDLTGKSENDDYGTNYYYPLKLVVKTDGNIIQKIDFDQDDFAPSTLNDFDFEFGNFKFDGYGGFKILNTSMGKNPSYYFWIWDKIKKSFVEYPDLEMVGDITFNYNDQTIRVVNTVSATYHEYKIYRYIDDKLTLVERVVDADNDGYRKVYKLTNGELELIEVTESQLK